MLEDIKSDLSKDWGKIPVESSTCPREVARLESPRVLFQPSESELYFSWGNETPDTDNILLSSPPRRIPRLLKKSHSAYTQARNVAESKYLCKKPNQLRPIRSFVRPAGGNSPQDFSTRVGAESTSYRIPAIETARLFGTDPQKHPGKNTIYEDKEQQSNKYNFALNSNANAATGSRLTAHLGAVLLNGNLSPKSQPESALDSAVNYIDVTGSLEKRFDRQASVSGNTQSSSSPSSVISPSSLTHRTARKSVNSPHLPVLDAENTRSVCKDSVLLTTNDNVTSTTLKPCQKRAYNNGSRFSRVSNTKFASHYRVEKDIAAGVRCNCGISSSTDSCKHCQSNQKSKETSARKGQTSKEFNGNVKQERSKDFRQYNSVSEPVFPPVLSHRKATTSDCTRRNSSGLTHRRAISTLLKDHINPFVTSRSRDCSSSESTEIEHQTSSNNRYNSEDSEAETHQRGLHCCDAFCLLFGGSQTNQLSATFVFNKLLHAAQAASPKHTTTSSTLGILTPEQSDMGCFHSVSNKSKVGPCRTNIFSEVQATIDQSPTVIEEYSPIVLRYRTPYFRANAQVIMPPIRRKETWTVGWIQACDYMKFINQYGNLGW